MFRPIYSCQNRSYIVLFNMVIDVDDDEFRYFLLVLKEIKKKFKKIQ